MIPDGFRKKPDRKIESNSNQPTVLRFQVLPQSRTVLRDLALYPSHLCLDAPLVGVSWSILLGVFANGSVVLSNQIALFSAVWFIYLADRIYDIRPVVAQERNSLRHRFAASHRKLLASLAIVALLAGASAIPFLQNLAWGEILFIAAAVVLYFLLFRFTKKFPTIRLVPLKELSIAACFTAGIFAAAGLEFGVQQFGLFITLTALFLANCLIISLAEQEEDETSDPAAFFSRPGKWPTRILGALFFACWLLLIGCVMESAFLETASKRFIGSALGVSLGGLVLIHSKLESSKPFTQALADAALLSPIFFLGLARIIESFSKTP